MWVGIVTGSTAANGGRQVHARAAHHVHGILSVPLPYGIRTTVRCRLKAPPACPAPPVARHALWANVPLFLSRFFLHVTRTGKPRFKRHLRALLRPLLSDTRCGHQLAESAAARCLGQLREWIGPRILEGALKIACMCMGTRVWSVDELSTRRGGRGQLWEWIGPGILEGGWHCGHGCAGLCVRGMC